MQDKASLVAALVESVQDGSVPPAEMELMRSVFKGLVEGSTVCQGAPSGGGRGATRRFRRYRRQGGCAQRGGGCRDEMKARLVMALWGIVVAAGIYGCFTLPAALSSATVACETMGKSMTWRESASAFGRRSPAIDDPSCQVTMFINTEVRSLKLWATTSGLLGNSYLTKVLAGSSLRGAYATFNDIIRFSADKLCALVAGELGNAEKEKLASELKAAMEDRLFLTSEVSTLKAALEARTGTGAVAVTAATGRTTLKRARNTNDARTGAKVRKTTGHTNARTDVRKEVRANEGEEDENEGPEDENEGSEDEDAESEGSEEDDPPENVVVAAPHRTRGQATHGRQQGGSTTAEETEVLLRLGSQIEAFLEHEGVPTKTVDVMLAALDLQPDASPLVRSVADNPAASTRSTRKRQRGGGCANDGSRAMAIVAFVVLLLGAGFSITTYCNTFWGGSGTGGLVTASCVGLRTAMANLSLYIQTLGQSGQLNDGARAILTGTGIFSFASYSRAADLICDVASGMRSAASMSAAENDIVVRAVRAAGRPPPLAVRVEAEEALEEVEGGVKMLKLIRSRRARPTRSSSRKGDKKGTKGDKKGSKSRAAVA